MSRKYTLAERKLIADTLRKAKKYLWDGVSPPYGKNAYICYAVSDTAGNDYKLYQLVTGLILNRLGNHAFVTGWLSAQGIPQEQLTKPNVQAYRKRWMNALIREFSR